MTGTEPRDHDLLIKLSENLQNIENKIDRFMTQAEGNGFSRCVERLLRIQRLEDDIIKMKKAKENFDVWLMRLTWAVIIAGVVKMAFFPDK